MAELSDGPNLNKIPEKVVYEYLILPDDDLLVPLIFRISMDLGQAGSLLSANPVLYICVSSIGDN